MQTCEIYHRIVGHFQVLLLLLFLATQNRRMENHSCVIFYNVKFLRHQTRGFIRLWHEIISVVNQCMDVVHAKTCEFAGATASFCRKNYARAIYHTATNDLRQKSLRTSLQRARLFALLSLMLGEPCCCICES
jgi:hypothetical protein